MSTFYQVESIDNYQP